MTMSIIFCEASESLHSETLSLVVSVNRKLFGWKSRQVGDQAPVLWPPLLVLLISCQFIRFDTFSPDEDGGDDREDDKQKIIKGQLHAPIRMMFWKFSKQPWTPLLCNISFRIEKYQNRYWCAKSSLLGLIFFILIISTTKNICGGFPMGAAATLYYKQPEPHPPVWQITIHCLCAYTKTCCKCTSNTGLKQYEVHVLQSSWCANVQR